MVWPVTFGNAVSPEPMSTLDTMFNATAAMVSIPCSASGTNAISLTPFTNCPALTSYNNLGGYRFGPAATTTGPVTLQYNSLGFLPVFKADGVTQCSTGDLIYGQQYIATYSQYLGGGTGGFWLESPSVNQAGSSGGQYTPGGRISVQSGVPIPTLAVISTTTVWYAPYIHPYVTIFNGSSVNQYQFTSSTSDQVGLSLAMAGNAAWPTGSVHDLFVFINSGVPTLGTVQWSSVTGRATPIGIFAGFNVNAAAANLRITGGSTVLVPSQQATLLGSLFMSGNGTTGISSYGAATGGFSCFCGFSNYYNQILLTFTSQDSGAPYTYTSATNRVARASGGNAMSLVQCSSERAVLGITGTNSTTVASTSAGLNVGISGNLGSSPSTNPNVSQHAQGIAAGALSQTSNLTYAYAGGGLLIIALTEAGDGVNANTFNAGSVNFLQVSAWQ